MKPIKWILALPFISVLVSCPMESYPAFFVETPTSITLPAMTGFSFRDNCVVTLYFDRDVRFLELVYDDTRMTVPSGEKNSFRITLPHPLDFGKETRLRFTVKGSFGGLSRLSLPLMGENPDQAKMLLTEISVSGTDTSPDRVELTAIEGGNTGALTITDALVEDARICYVLPNFRLEKGDVVVVQFGRSYEGPETERVSNYTAYYLDAGTDEDFTSTNGAVLLYGHTNGEGRLLDAFLYRKDDTVLADGFGNERTRRAAVRLAELGQWNGEAFESEGNTSTRVFARRHPYMDFDSSDDWYLTATRGSTFGRRNDNNEYDPD